MKHSSNVFSKHPLRDALLAKGIPVTFQLIEGAGHGGPAINKGSASPIREFLHRTILLD